MGYSYGSIDGFKLVFDEGTKLGFSVKSSEGFKYIRLDYCYNFVMFLKWCSFYCDNDVNNEGPPLRVLTLIFK